MALDSVVYNKAVDVAQSMPVPVIFAKQHESGKRKVIVTLLKDGQPFVIGTGISGYIQGATAQNPVTKQPIRFKRALTSLDTTANTATFVIAESMTAEIGITRCEIALYDTTKPNEIVCTANINIEVQGTGMSPQDEMASDDYQAIVSIKAEVTAMRDEVRTKTNQAIAAQAAAETAAQNAYNSALNVQKIVVGNEAYTKQETDLKYSVAPRKAQASTTGELKLADADYGLSYLELQGNSKQYTNTASANLFDAEYNKSLGLDATDKYLRTTGEIDISVGWSYSYYIKVVPNTLYSFVGIPASPAASFVFYTKDKTYISGISTKDAVIDLVRAVTTPNNCEWMRISYRYNNQIAMYLGQPPSQGVMGAVETPSPDYPSEVKSVGDIPKDSNGVEIRNLLDEVLEDLLIYEDSKDFIYLKLSSNVITGNYAVWSKKTPVSNGLYCRLSKTIIGWGDDGSIQIVAQGVYNGTEGTSYPFNFINSSDLYITFTHASTSGNEKPSKEMIKAFFETYNIMVTSAAEIDEYRPYIGSNNGLVKIESQGKNLFNTQEIYNIKPASVKIEGDTVIIDGVSGYVNQKMLVGKFKENTQYTLSLYSKRILNDTSIGDGNFRFRAVFTDGTGQDLGVLNYDNYTYTKATTLANKTVNYITIDYNQFTIKIWLKELQIEEGAQATEYQPYYNKITWIPLREPLRGITGNNLKLYADKVDKNGYVAQNIYFAEGKAMFTFDTDALGINASDSPYKYAYWPMQSIAQRAYPGTISVLCNMLKRGTYNVNQMAITNTSVIVFNLPNTLTGLADAETDKAAITAAIKAWVNTNNPMVYYALKNPIEYQIPMVYIETYDQETNVRCLNKVKPSSMGLDYKIAISSLIKRLEALESAAVNNGGK